MTDILSHTGVLRQLRKRLSGDPRDMFPYVDPACASIDAVLAELKRLQVENETMRARLEGIDASTKALEELEGDNDER